MPRLIINADDLGYSKERDEGILKCIQEGIVTSTSLLVNGANASRILPYAIDNGIPVGLHINLTEGLPVSPLEQVSSLLGPSNSNGCSYMRGKMGFRTALKEGEIQTDHIRTEIVAQYNQFVRYATVSRTPLTASSITTLGDTSESPSPPPSDTPDNNNTNNNSNTVNTASPPSSSSSSYHPTHFDGHQHIHVLPPLQPIVRSIFANSSSSSSCSSSTPVFTNKTRVPKLSSDIQLMAFLPRDRQIFYESIDRDSRTAEQLWRSTHTTETNGSNDGSIRNPSFFIGYTTMGKDCQLSNVKEVLQTAINNATETDDTIEWMVHPGYRTRKRNLAMNETLDGGNHSRNENNDDDAGCGQGPDDFAMSEDREIEMNLLLDKNYHLRVWLEDQNVTLISYRDL